MWFLLSLRLKDRDSIGERPGFTTAVSSYDKLNEFSFLASLGGSSGSSTTSSNIADTYAVDLASSSDPLSYTIENLKL